MSAAPQTTVCASGCVTRHRRRLPQAAVVLVAAALVAVFTTGVAFAYWAATATGVATAGAATAVSLSVSAVPAPGATLYPGRTEDLSFTLANPNPYNVSLTTLKSASVASSDPIACPSSSITLPPAVTTAMAAGGYQLPAALSVPSGATGTLGSLTAFVTMATSAPDGCQAKTFTVSLTFAGSQV